MYALHSSIRVCIKINIICLEYLENKERAPSTVSATFHSWFFCFPCAFLMLSTSKQNQQKMGKQKMKYKYV